MSTAINRCLIDNQPKVSPAKKQVRIHVHYLIAIVSLGIYGGQVCPYVDSLGLLDNILLLSLIFASMALIRPVLVRRKVSGSNCQQRMVSVARLDLSLYLIAALLLSSYFWLNFNFPFTTGLKVLFGFSLLGFFAALDTAAQEEQLAIESGKISEGKTTFLSLGNKVLIFTGVVCSGLVIVMLLLVAKDMEWLLSDTRELNDFEAVALITFEFFFVLAFLLGSMVNVVRSYSGNLSLRLSAQAEVLSDVADGELQQRIHDVGNDELTRLSGYINSTLSALEAGHLELSATRDLTIRALSSLAETRDNDTGLHIIRTQHYVKILAERLSAHPDFSAQLVPSFVELLYKSAPLHDIGKIGIPDHILLKPGKLTADEFTIMQTHAELGRNALACAAQGNEASEFLRLAQEIALNHHEKWDGSGYPNQLSGTDIPLSARLMALADVYDALISKRVYKKAMTHEQAREIILEGRGTHFDPRVVDAFLSTENSFLRISQQYCE